MASHVDETTLNNTEIYTTPRDAATAVGGAIEA